MITVTYGMQLLQAATYINTINAGQEQRPDIAALSNGNMFVAWQTEALGIQGSLRTADGQSIGGNFAIAGLRWSATSRLRTEQRQCRRDFPGQQ